MLTYITDANVVIPIASAEVFASHLIVLLNVALVAWGLLETYALLFGSKVWSHIMEPISNAFWTPLGISLVCLFIGGSFLILTTKLLDEICDKITERIQSLKTEIYEKEQQIAKMQNTINELQSLKIQIPDTPLFAQSSKKTI